MTREELDAIASKENGSAQGFKHRLNVCVGAGCLASQADTVLSALQTELRAKGLEKECALKGVGCLGLCKAGPLVALEGEKVMYQNVTAGDAAEIVQALDTKPVERLAC